MDDEPTKKKVLNTTEWTAGENADEADVIQMCSTQNTTHRHRCEEGEGKGESKRSTFVPL